MKSKSKKIIREVRIHDGIRCYGTNTGIVFHFVKSPTSITNKIPVGEPFSFSNEDFE